jgi:hypothetical protein
MKLHPCTGRSWGLICSVRETCAHHQAFSGPINDVHEPLSPYARALCSGPGLPDYSPVTLLRPARAPAPQLELFA